LSDPTKTDLYDRLQKLRARATDQSSTDNERKIAATVASRLELRIEAMDREDPVWDSFGRVRRSTPANEALKTLDAFPVDSPWPSWYAGKRESVEFQAVLNHSEFCIGWDCPQCGAWVSKAIPVLRIAKMYGSKMDPFEAIQSMMDGRYNQLCAGCVSAHKE